MQHDRFRFAAFVFDNHGAKLLLSGRVASEERQNCMCELRTFRPGDPDVVVVLVVGWEGISLAVT